jgi:hypothetical protein
MYADLTGTAGIFHQRTRQQRHPGPTPAQARIASSVPNPSTRTPTDPRRTRNTSNRRRYEQPARNTTIRNQLYPIAASSVPALGAVRATSSTSSTRNITSAVRLETQSPHDPLS